MTFLQTLLGLGVNDERAWSSWSVTTSAAGESVSYSAALKMSAYYACVRLISDTVGILPKHIMERRSDSERVRATNHPLYDIIHAQPNRIQTSIEFFSMMTAHVVMRNNAYARYEAGPRGFVDQLIPLHPDLVRIEYLPDGVYRYMVRERSGQPEKPYNDEDILHLRGFQQNIAQGVDMLPLINESVGVSAATQKYRARFFGNNASPGGVLKKPGKLTDEGKKNLKTSWEAAHSGNSQHRVAVLEDGLEWQSIGIDPRASQLIESEEYNAEDICRWLGVPPFMIGLTSKSTSWGTGIEQQNIGFVTYTIMPLTVRWQQAIARDLILAPQKYYVEFVLDGLLRGDSQQRYNVYSIGRELGMFTPNDLLRMENMNPRTDEGGDSYVPDMGRSLTPAQIPPTMPEPMPGQAHYRELIEENAARVVRKESAAIRTAEKRVDFTAQVRKFFGEHSEFVSQTMRISLDAGEHWATTQMQLALSAPVEFLKAEPQRIAALVALAGGE